MAELVDALVSGTSNRKVVQVQVLFRAPNQNDFPLKNLNKNFRTKKILNKFFNEEIVLIWCPKQDLNKRERPKLRSASGASDLRAAGQDGLTSERPRLRGNRA